LHKYNIPAVVADLSLKTAAAAAVAAVEDLVNTVVIHASQQAGLE